MTKYKVAMAGAFLSLALGAGGLSAAWWLYGKIQAFERLHGGDVLAGQTKAQVDEALKAKIAAQQAAVKGRGEAQPSQGGDKTGGATPDTLEILNVSCPGDDTLTLDMTHMPDMEAIRHYVTVTPMNEGALSFRHAHLKSRGVHQLTVSGDFAFRTNLTLVVRQGLNGLKEDFVHSFTRRDRNPLLAFADTGRYLPPAGARAVALKSVNVTNIAARVRIVPRGNIVQLLALEERAYDHISTDWWREDEEFVDDLAGQAAKTTLATNFEPNRETRSLLPVGERNGVFFVEVSGDKHGPDACRTVCVTDLGLSVRETPEALYVWVNSLTTGESVADALVEVYSSANVLVAAGRTDAQGLCRTEKVADGTPFAVIVQTANGDDTSFLALRESMMVDETFPGGWREKYLAANDVSAFLWTERGIYRHDETIFVHALLRDGTFKAPAPFPVRLRLVKPSGDVYAHVTLTPDASGALANESFTVPGDQPSGAWSLQLVTPGEKGRLLGSRTIKIEEFAPPQIRVKATPRQRGAAPADFAFTVSAEHLYGGAAKGLACEGAVVFEDAAFAPAAWRGYRFGNDDLGLKPSFRRLGKGRLDDAGENVFPAPLWADAGKPRAAIKVTAQGTVFEDGGRPATARCSDILHYYPFYIGATLGDTLRRPEMGLPQIDIACVLPDGSRLAETKRLVARLDRVENVYAYRRNAQGWATWDCERVRTTIADQIALETLPDRDTVFSLPVRECGDYVLTITDRTAEASFSKAFYLSDWGDDTVRAALSEPTAVSITPDKPFYRVGESPRLVIKSPFTGQALLTVLRDNLECVATFALTNATSEVMLPPVPASWAPSVDVALSVVGRVSPGEKHFAVRAHGETLVAVRPAEYEIPVSLDAQVTIPPCGPAQVDVTLSAPTDGATAVVTLVDEGIHLLTDEPVPDPVGFFAQPRTADHPLYDFYHRLLPALGEDALKTSGVKTGGGFGAEMLSRVSPVPTRRFKPLALWQTAVPVVDGRAHVVFSLPEFVGEVRISAVVSTATATGAGAITRKVAPKIVMQPDAPRFVAPGDVFEATLPLSNRSGEEAEVGYGVSVSGPLRLVETAASGTCRLAKDASLLERFRIEATGVGEGAITFMSSGAGETHEKTLYLPVRPAVPWRETAGVDILKPGESRLYPAESDTRRFAWSVASSPVAELQAALDWLADYPHGCLEQTTSRIFPLLNTTNEAIVAAGVRRVESMIRSCDFVMWPDCDTVPWDREVSLYAADFLTEAWRAQGGATSPTAQTAVMKFLKNWALSTNETVAAYACHTLAHAGKPDKDRMLRLYDRRETLDALSRARLARAFLATFDRARAADLLATAGASASVKEAAFALLALLELDPNDPRIPTLVAYLLAQRDKTRLEWGTTETNAHALLALGAYYRQALGAAASTAEARVESIMNDDGSLRLVNAGSAEAFVSWKMLDLPSPADVKAEHSILRLTRRLLTREGAEVAPEKLERGDLIVVELTLASSEDRDYADLVIEDLFAGALEPAHAELDTIQAGDTAWILRTDARDDRMLVFSRKFHMARSGEVVFRYPVRVVSAGRFILPGASVEAMYAPAIRARTAATTVEAK